MLLDFFAVVLATGAIIEVWHKGSLFAEARAYVQAVQDVTPPESLKSRLLELLMCPFCKSYHVPFWLFVVLLAGDGIGATIGGVARLVIYALAATRVSNLLDGFLPPRMRYDPPLEGASHGRGPV
jgi:hypothetical protein